MDWNKRRLNIRIAKHRRGEVYGELTVDSDVVVVVRLVEIAQHTTTTTTTIGLQWFSGVHNDVDNVISSRRWASQAHGWLDQIDRGDHQEVLEEIQRSTRDPRALFKSHRNEPDFYFILVLEYNLSRFVYFSPRRRFSHARTWTTRDSTTIWPQSNAI